MTRYSREEVANWLIGLALLLIGIAIVFATLALAYTGTKAGEAIPVTLIITFAGIGVATAFAGGYVMNRATALGIAAELCRMVPLLGRVMPGRDAAPAADSPARDPAEPPHA